MRVNVIKPEEATGKTKELLEAVKKGLGKVPNILGTMAHSEAALSFYLSASQALKEGRLSNKEREQIALTVAGQNGCDYCASAHSYVGKLNGLSTEEVQRNLQGKAQDPVTAKLLEFVKSVMENRGHVGDQLVTELKALGVGEEVMIETVANIALNIFTNYFNHVVQTDIDFPKVEISR